MLSNTHAYIAGKVYDYLSDYTGVEVSKFNLKYGSIKPDYVPNLFLISHYQKDSLDFIKREIKALASLPYSECKENKNHYSIQLGVIVHFLSDYFCYAHNNKILEENIIKHYLYEKELEKSLPKFEAQLDRFKNSELFPQWSVLNMVDYLDSRLKTYKIYEVSYFNDLKHAIHSCCVVCRSILTSSLDKSKLAA